MTKKLKVTKVDKKKRTITVDTDHSSTYIEPTDLSIWVGEVKSLEGFNWIPIEEMTKEELEKKYPKEED